MAGLNAQLVRLPDSSSVTIDTLQSGSLVSGVALPGLGLNEQDFRNWSSTDISSTSLGVAGVVFETTHSGSVIEFNGGDLTVSEHQNILIKDSSGSYYFTPANTVNLNSDYLVKYTDNGIVEELITSAYEIQNQSIHTIAIEDIDVYLADGYIVHNPPGYSIYDCNTSAYLGDRWMIGFDPGANSPDCHEVTFDEGGTFPRNVCVYTCDPAEADFGIDLAPFPCGSSPGCGEGDTSIGPEGPAGPEGPQGAKGVKGSTGATGSGGPNGLEGAAGPQGSTGPQGAQGPTGPAGTGAPKGTVGSTGAVGAAGNTGAQGPQGAKGNTGAAGNKGITGASGIQGATGPTGNAGNKGITGVGGDKGNTGAAGNKGVTGAQGYTGPQGDTGHSAGYFTMSTVGTTISNNVNNQSYTITRDTTGNAWSKSAYSDQARTGNISLSFKVSDLGYKMIGLNSDPTTNDSYTTIDYAWYSNSRDGGRAEIYENGSGKGTHFSGMTADDYLIITYDNQYIRYYSFDDSTGITTLERSVNAGSGLSLYMDSSLYSSGTKADNLTFSSAQIGAKGNTGSTGAAGNKGITGNGGATGATGPTGHAGNKGITGSSGIQGATGPTGDAGNKGITGAGGDKGNKGTTGHAGNKGITGDQGNKGNTGNAGNKGITGAGGATGATGPTGDAGNKGITGAGGDKGNKGTTGDAGNKGITGASGIQGATGPTGDAGNKGITGPSGNNGNKGNTGDAGNKGNTGAGGDKGNNGEGLGGGYFIWDNSINKMTFRLYGYSAGDPIWIVETYQSGSY